MPIAARTWKLPELLLLLTLEISVGQRIRFIVSASTSFSPPFSPLDPEPGADFAPPCTASAASAQAGFVRPAESLCEAGLITLACRASRSCLEVLPSMAFRMLPDEESDEEPLELPNFPLKPQTIGPCAESLEPDWSDTLWGQWAGAKARMGLRAVP